MAKEIERKFLVLNNSYKNLAYKCLHIRQGYISTNKDATVRIRIIGNNAVITIKGTTKGIMRNEWEYPIPYNDAVEMIKELAQGHVIDKYRYYLNYCGSVWEIDEFYGAHSGLVIAEIELKEENESVSLPPFVGEEVTGNPAYYNSNLATCTQ